MRAGGRGQTSLKAQGALGFPHGLEPHPSSLIAPCIQSMSLTKSGAPGRASHGPYSSPRVYAKHLDRKRINFVKYLQDPRHNGRHQTALLKGTQCSHYVFSPYYFVICNSFQRIKESQVIICTLKYKKCCSRIMMFMSTMSPFCLSYREGFGQNSIQEGRFWCLACQEVKIE